MLLQKGDEAFVDLSGEHHLDDVRRLFIGIPEPADKFAFDPHPVEHRVDLRAAAVDQDDLDPVRHDGLLEIVVEHSVPAVFDHDDLVVILLDIGERVDQNLRLFFVADMQHKNTRLIK